MSQTVPDVAKKIAAEQKPDEMSAQSKERMFLVYPNYLIHVQQDPQKTEDTLVEVDTKQFVRQNYDPKLPQRVSRGVAPEQHLRQRMAQLSARRVHGSWL